MPGRTDSPPFPTLERHYRVILAAIMGAAVLLAWLRRFVNDDAFISFRYARNLAEGHGLVFNIGERVEGYTNFLWTALLALPHIAGIDPETFCYALGPPLAAASLYFTFRAALVVTGSRMAALLVTALLAFNPSFVAWATGGLETGLLTCLLAAAVCLMLESVADGEALIGRNVALSLLAAAALMTRLDAVLVAGVAVATVALHGWKIHPRGQSVRLIAALIAPAAAILFTWLAWKYIYYGAILPNTYLAKVGGGNVWPRGFAYLFIFLNSYLLWPFILLVAWSAPRLVERFPWRAAPLLVMLAAQGAYLIQVGGDFMEFRLLVPVLPVLYILIVWSLPDWTPRFSLRAAVVILLAAGALHHFAFFEFRRGIESVAQMDGHLRDRASDWVGVGRALGRDLKGSRVLIAVTPAGAIPYYSRLPALDMLGLTDAWVARHGMPIRSQPGHRRLAPYSRLLSSGVHLVVAHPWLALRSSRGRTTYAVEELKGFSYLADPAAVVFPDHARILEIPLDAERVLVALYLTGHPAIDNLIAGGQWRSFRLAATSS